MLENNTIVSVYITFTVNTYNKKRNAKNELLYIFRNMLAHYDCLHWALGLLRTSQNCIIY